MKRFVRFFAVMILGVMLLGILPGCGNQIPEGAEVCPVCYGEKKCTVCDGDAVLEMGGLLGENRHCAFCSRNPGCCKTCDGTGYVFPGR